MFEVVSIVGVMLIIGTMMIADITYDGATLVLGADGVAPPYEVRDTAPERTRDRITPLL